MFTKTNKQVCNKMTLHKDYTKSEDTRLDWTDDLIWLGFVLLSTWMGISTNGTLWFFFGPIVVIGSVMQLMNIIHKLRNRQNRYED